MPAPSLGFKIGPHFAYLRHFKGEDFLRAGHNLQLIGEPPPDDAARQGIIPAPVVPYGGDVTRPPVAIDASPTTVPTTPVVPGATALPDARQAVRAARRTGRQDIRGARQTGRQNVRQIAATGDTQATANAIIAKRAAIQEARGGARKTVEAAQLERVLSRGRARQARRLPRRTLRQARREAKRTKQFVLP